MFSSIVQYWLTNNPTVTLWKDLGQRIALESTQDEVVFIKARDFFIRPEMVFYAHRNIAYWQDRVEARIFIRGNRVKEGIVFTLNETNTAITGVEHIRID
jgi:hypothetical protein